MKFQLIIITSPLAFANELIWVERLFATGLKKLHVRKPGYSKTQLRNYLSKIPYQYHSRIVLHSHYSLAKEFSIGGIHLTENTRKKALPFAYNKHRHSLSASLHDIENITRSRREYDYVFLSPVFDSISKRKYKSAFSEELLEKFLLVHKNVVALGGIELKTVRTAQQMKFAGAATLGFIWESKDPVKAFKQLASKIK